MYAYSYVLENIDIDTNLEEGINKRLSLFTLYVFVFVLLLFLTCPLQGGRERILEQSRKKNQLFNCFC